jgi:hypothetical protein
MIRYKILSNNNTSFRAMGKYSILYEENKIIECIPGTIGIMCFNNLKNVKSFLSREIARCIALKSPPEFCDYEKKYGNYVGNIYSVETIDEIKTPKFITFSTTSYLDNYIKSYEKNMYKNIKPNNRNSINPYSIKDNVIIYLQKAPRGTICAKKIKLVNLEYIIV